VYDDAATTRTVFKLFLYFSGKCYEIVVIIKSAVFSYSVHVCFVTRQIENLITHIYITSFKNKIQKREVCAVFHLQLRAGPKVVPLQHL
jgi:hypothetical protein